MKHQHTRKSHRIISQWQSTCIVGAICLLVILLSEVFVFNLPYWQTRHEEPQTITNFSLGEGLSRTENGDLTIDGDNNYIEISSGNAIKYLYLNINSTSADRGQLHYTLSTQQQHLAEWFDSSRSRTMMPSFDKSKYLQVNNNTSHVRIRFDEPQGTTIGVTNIVINPPIRFDISGLRVLIMATIALFIIFLRPSSPLYRIAFTDRLTIRSPQLYGLLLLLLIEIAILIRVWLWTAGPGADRSPIYEPGFFFKIDRDQYALLGDALIHGHTYLDLPVPDTLSSMSNPYDTTLRRLATDNGSIPIYWDHAFYDGHYYSYFGVVPAVLLYVPYQLLTGHWLSTAPAVLLMGIIATCLASVLVVQIVRTYFNERASFGMILLCTIMLNLASSVHYQVFTPNFYAIPGVASVMFTFAALSLWLYGKRHACSKVFIALGSFCMALNLGCRPQFILASVLALPIFWNELVHQRLFLAPTKQALGNTAVAFLPFIIVFIPLLAYNAARFSGPFDFGAEYNLTVFNVRDTQFSMRNLLPLLYYYLFRPPNVIGTFPFVELVSTPLAVWYPTEPSPGGMLAICPFLLIVFATTVLLGGKAHNRHRMLCLSFLILASAILIVDTSTGGLSWRYYLDSGWLLGLVAVFCAMRIGQLHLGASLHEQTDVAALRNSALLTMTHLSIIMLFLAVAVSALILGFSSFATGRFSSIITVNPHVYYEVMQWFLPFS